MRVSVAWSPRAGEAFEIALEVEADATVRAAIERSGVLDGGPAFDWTKASLGVFGRPVEAEAALKEGDRVEVYRPLAVDPKESRRRRASGNRKR